MSPLSSQKILEVLSDPRLGINEIKFSEEVISLFQKFFTVFQKWNGKINLTSERDAGLILEKHVFDSLHYLRWIDPSHKILDIGSGAGFPGIPIKIIQPELEMALLDSQRKRCNFLRELVRALDFAGVDVLEGRAEKISGQAELAGRFDRVLFRGFASLKHCLSVGLPFLKEGGQMILMKNPDELPEADTQPLPGTRLLKSQLVEKIDGIRSVMVIIEKCSTWNI